MLKLSGWNGVQAYRSPLQGADGSFVADPEYQGGQGGSWGPGYQGGHGAYGEISQPETLTPFQQQMMQEMASRWKSQQTPETTVEPQATSDLAETQSGVRGTLDTASQLLMTPGSGLRGLTHTPGLATGAYNDLQQGNYGMAALQGAGAALVPTLVAQDANLARQGFQAAKGLPASAVPMSLKSLAPAVQGAPGKIMAAATKAMPTLMPAAARLAKFIPGVGGALSTGANVSSAVTGDQGYLSDNIWGQYGEQALRSAGDVVGIFANPLTGIINTAATVANAGVNGVRAIGDTVAAHTSGQQGDAYAAKHQGAMDSRAKWQQYVDTEAAAGRQADYKTYKAQQPSAAPSTGAVPAAPSTGTGAAPKALQPGGTGATHEVK